MRFERILRIVSFGRNIILRWFVGTFPSLSIYAKVGNQAFRLLKNNTPGPYTFCVARYERSAEAFIKSET